MVRAIVQLANTVLPEALVIARDLDRQPERRRGFRQVMDDPGMTPPFPVVYAGADPEIEAWQIAGFEPETAAEHQALARMKEALGFWPHREAHRLTSRPNDAPTDAKRVLCALTNGDPDRSDRCLDDLPRLADRGSGRGVTAFLDDAERLLVPLVAGRRAP